MYVFKTPQDRASMPLADLDKWLEYFHIAFLDGKFYSIFSMLFGIGFAIIFYDKKGEGNRLTLFYRRLFILLIIGIVHAFFIWDGDILMFYALTGCVLPLFRNLQPKTLFIVAAAMIFTPLIFDLLKVVTNDNWNISKPLLDLAIQYDNSVGISEQNTGQWLVTNTTYSDLLNWNRSGFFWSLQMRLDGNRIFKVLAMFLIGLAVGKLKVYQRMAELKPQLLKIMYVMFIVGITGGIAKVYFESDGIRLPKAGGLWDTFAYSLNAAPLAIAYSIALGLVLTKSQFNFLSWLLPVGRMALTNYIMQSVICITIYYGIGAGLATHVGPSAFMPIAVFVFILQVFYSRLWLVHFNFGPLEWIWRQLAYGRRMPIRKA